MPACAVLEGWVVIARAAAASATTVNVAVVALPLAPFSLNESVSVKSPAVLVTRSLKVAVPLPSVFALVAPEARVAPLRAAVTEYPLSALPY